MVRKKGDWKRNLDWSENPPFSHSFHRGRKVRYHFLGKMRRGKFVRIGKRPEIVRNPKSYYDSLGTIKPKDRLKRIKPLWVEFSQNLGRADTAKFSALLGGQGLAGDFVRHAKPFSAAKFVKIVGPAIAAGFIKHVGVEEGGAFIRKIFGEADFLIGRKTIVNNIVDFVQRVKGSVAGDFFYMNPEAASFVQLVGPRTASQFVIGLGVGPARFLVSRVRSGGMADLIRLFGVKKVIQVINQYDNPQYARTVLKSLRRQREKTKA